MSQHDYDLVNAAGSSFRSDVNSVLAAIVSQNSGSSAPATTFAYQLWADTTAGLLKIRNAANSAWVTVGNLAAANLGLQLYDAATAKTNVAQNYTKGQRGAVTALTDAATVAVDLSLSNNFSLLTTSGIGSTRKLGNPTNIVAGQSGVIAVTTDAVSRLLTFDTYYKFVGGTAPVLSATSAAVDYFSYYVETATRIFISQAKDVK